MDINNPQVEIVDKSGDGDVVQLSDGANFTKLLSVLAAGDAAAAAKGFVVYGLDPSNNAKAISIDGTGELRTDLMRVGGTAITLGQKANAASLPASLSTDQMYAELTSILAKQGMGVLGNDAGTFRWLKVDATGALAVQTQPSPNVFFVVGEVTSSTTTTKTVEKTVYTEQTVDAQRSLVSTSALDTGAGTGARTVIITFLDSTGAGPFTETITLAGTVAVNTVATNICFIEKMEVVTVGSTGLNQGIINLKAAVAGGGVTIGSIAALDLQTFWCHHYIPTGKTMKVTGISVSHNGTTVGSGAAFWIKRKPIPLGNSTEIQITDFVRLYGQSSTFSRLYNSPVKATGPARILMYATPESASTFIYRAAIDFYEE